MEGKVQNRGTASRFLCHKATQKCEMSPLWGTENSNRAEVFPDHPVMEGDDTCFIFPRKAQLFKNWKTQHCVESFSATVFLHNWATFAQLWTAPAMTDYVSVIRCCEQCQTKELVRIVRITIYFDAFP